MSRATFIQLVRDLSGRFVGADVPKNMIFWNTAAEAFWESRPLVIVVSKFVSHFKSKIFFYENH